MPTPATQPRHLCARGFSFVGLQLVGMTFIKAVGIFLLFIVNSIIGCTLGFLHLPQPYVALPSQTTATTTQAVGTTTKETTTHPPFQGQRFANGTLYGGWFSVQALPSACNSVDTAANQYGALEQRADGIYLDNNKLAVDPPTFEVFCEIKTGARLFWRDANDLYVDGVPAHHAGNNLEVDQSTFMPEQSGTKYEMYGRDRSYAYATTWEPGGLTTISAADIGSFGSNPALFPFARDKSHVYLGSQIVKEADPISFRVVDSSHAVDRYRVYYLSTNGNGLQVLPIPGAATSTFTEPAALTP